MTLLYPEIGKVMDAATGELPAHFVSGQLTIPTLVQYAAKYSAASFERGNVQCQAVVACLTLHYATVLSNTC